MPEVETLSSEVRLTSFSHGGGCACKLGTLELADILSYVKSGVEDQALLVGLDAPDDAAVYRISDDLALVQTVDFFTPIVDDAWAWGRIAAANALSDVYAMGGRPVTALNLVAWPRSLDFALLGAVIEGAQDACAEAGVAIVGGHSVDDPEPKFGLSVTGFVDPAAIVTKRGARPGDELVLTKPLGMGIISSAVKSGDASPAAQARAIEVMSQLNRSACGAMLKASPSAATDVTGFGLAGHLLQMLGDDLDARLDWGAVPVVDDVIDLARAGILPGGTKRNRDAAADVVSTGDLAEHEAVVLFDAQTSGGLLIALPPERTGGLLAELDAAGVSDAARIGAVTAGSGRIEVGR